jgi:hypothetical protein
MAKLTGADVKAGLKQWAENEDKPKVDKDLAQIEEIKKGLGDLVARMGAVKVKTQADYETAVTLGKEGAQSIKALKAAGEAAALPYNKALDKIKTALSGIVTAIETASDAMREECKAFIRREEAKKQKELAELAEKKRKEEQAILDANTAKEQVKAQTKVEKTEVKMEFVAAQKTDNSTTFRKVEVIDEALVPRQYLSVDTKKLNSIKGAIGTPYPNVPGVRFVDEKIVRF